MHRGQPARRQQRSRLRLGRRDRGVRLRRPAAVAACTCGLQRGQLSRPRRRTRLLGRRTRPARLPSCRRAQVGAARVVRAGREPNPASQADDAARGPATPRRHCRRPVPRVDAHVSRLHRSGRRAPSTLAAARRRSARRTVAIPGESTVPKSKVRKKTDAPLRGRQSSATTTQALTPEPDLVPDRDGRRSWCSAWPTWSCTTSPNQSVPVMNDIGAWNFAVGFGIMLRRPGHGGAVALTVAAVHSVVHACDYTAVSSSPAGEKPVDNCRLTAIGPPRRSAPLRPGPAAAPPATRGDRARPLLGGDRCSPPTRPAGCCSASPRSSWSATRSPTSSSRPRLVATRRRAARSTRRRARRTAPGTRSMRCGPTRAARSACAAGHPRDRRRRRAGRVQPARARRATRDAARPGRGARPRRRPARVSNVAGAARRPTTTTSSQRPPAEPADLQSASAAGCAARGSPPIASARQRAGDEPADVPELRDVVRSRRSARSSAR